MLLCGVRAGDAQDALWLEMIQHSDTRGITTVRYPRVTPQSYHVKVMNHHHRLTKACRTIHVQQDP